jgi:putative nucleotidyltransferase with HDIG domain
MSRVRVLVVDDDASVGNMLGRYLEFLEHEVEVVTGVDGALASLQARCFDAVLSDISMPAANGMELLDWLTAQRPNTAVIMMSGRDDAELAKHSLQRGALEYVVKPFRLNPLAETLDRALSAKRSSRQRAEYLAALETRLEDKSAALQGTLDQLRAAAQQASQEARADSLELLTAALDAREHETLSHSRRVSQYSVHLAREMGVSGDQLEIIRQGAILHDIGKIGIPDHILLKPDSLTPEEWVEMRKHPEIGAWIMNGVDSLKAAANIVISHHERFDGQGYPLGLRGADIPMGARVFAVADTLDAITSERPYREGQPYEAARAEIEKNASTQFDPDVADCFLRIDPAEWDAIRERPNPALARAGRA